MATMYDKVIGVIGKRPEQRTDFEIQELIPWLRNKSNLFQSVKPEIVKDVIRNCDFERKLGDDIIIKQCDNGDNLYIILKGSCSIYVIQDKDTDLEIKDQVGLAVTRRGLDRSFLGQQVFTSTEGNAFGEIALIKEDCIRTASVVVDEPTDLVVINRTLYHRSVRDVLENEFRDKTEFVEKNILFADWSPRHKKQLAISFRKDSLQFGAQISKQGMPVTNAYFIIRGEVEISMDLAFHRYQYQTVWREMESLFPELLDSEKFPRASMSPHEQMLKRRIMQKSQPICLLADNESIGTVELISGLDTYIESAIVTAQTDVLALTKRHYERMLAKRHAESIILLKQSLVLKLYLYIYRTQSLGAPLLKYLSLKLDDNKEVTYIRKMKEREKMESNMIKKTQAAGTLLVREETNIFKLVQAAQEKGSPELQTGTQILETLDVRMKTCLWKQVPPITDPKYSKDRQLEDINASEDQYIGNK